MTTPGEARWKEMVAQLAQRVGMTPLDVEAATEGRVKAREVADLLTQQEGEASEKQEAEHGLPAEGEEPSKQTQE